VSGKAMRLDLNPLIGQSISALEKNDYTWCFSLSGRDLISTEQGWRMVTADGILVASGDHAQRFGLPSPLNAAELLKNNLKSALITEASHDFQTGDLFLRFPDQKYIQFLQMSCGYESWRLQIKGREFICMGGGKYASGAST
jgi:hypothetical protein